MRHTAARAIAGLAIAATAVLGLAACTGGPTPGASGGATAGQPGSADQAGDGGQSVADACALIQDTISSATAEFESSSAEDPAAVVESMRAAAEHVAGAVPQVTNDSVAALLPPLQSMYSRAAEVMQALVDGDVSKIGDLATLGTQFHETTQKFHDLCAP